MLHEIWRRFKKNRLALIGLVILCIFALIAFFAGVIAPYGYDDQDASRAMLFPSLAFIFGTDNLGRDVLSRLIYGSRYSLLIGFLAVGISVLFGLVFGVLSAYYRKLDNIIMRAMDLFMAIPQLLLAICIITALGQGLFNLMLAVGLSSTPQFARIVRASVLTTKEQEFIEAARAIGANNFRIIMSHILPNSLAPLIVQATLSMARAIISVSALSFLGFGIQPPEPEWGAMLSAGRMFIRTQWHLTVIPGLAIMAVVYSLNVVGDGLRDCLDPRLKK
jgi:peptide/nickel transport system permease protein